MYILTFDLDYYRDTRFVVDLFTRKWRAVTDAALGVAWNSAFFSQEVFIHIAGKIVNWISEAKMDGQVKNIRGRDRQGQQEWQRLHVHAWACATLFFAMLKLCSTTHPKIVPNLQFTWKLFQQPHTAYNPDWLSDKEKGVAWLQLMNLR